MRAILCFRLTFSSRSSVFVQTLLFPPRPQHPWEAASAGQGGFGPPGTWQFCSQICHFIYSGDVIPTPCSSISPSVWGQQSQPAKKRNAENIHALGRVHPWGAGGVMRGCVPMLCAETPGCVV